MSKGSENSGAYAPNYAYLGTLTVVPETKTPVGQGSYENKSQVSFNDKQTGSYVRATTTEKASAGDFHWQNGKSGTREEYKETSTVRIGDKSGYTEVYNEQRIRNVDFNNDSSSKNVVTYDNGDAGKYGGYEIGYDSGDGGNYGGYELGYDSGDGGNYGGYELGYDSGDGGNYGGYEFGYDSDY